jgi:inhibitor of KinA
MAVAGWQITMAAGRRIAEPIIADKRARITSRAQTPRVRVEPGSVGLTGRQTGIYPEARPGGWNLIGQTPLVLVDVAAGYFPLRAGDRVRFVHIDEATYRQREGERL